MVQDLIKQIDNQLDFSVSHKATESRLKLIVYRDYFIPMKLMNYALQSVFSLDSKRALRYTQKLYYEGSICMGPYLESKAVVLQKKLAVLIDENGHDLNSILVN